MRSIDIVISSTAAPHYILDRAEARSPDQSGGTESPLLLIDIAVPRDIDPDVNSLDNVYLYNIDDLQAIADDYLRQRQEEFSRCEQIIADKARALLERRMSALVSTSQEPPCASAMIERVHAHPILIATRGSALALAQAETVLAHAEGPFPTANFRA